MRTLRRNVSATLLAFSLTAVGSSACYAQGKQACELITKADAESILGVTLQQLRLYAPFRSLLDKDFTKGKMGDGCAFTNVAAGTPRPPKVIEVGIEVRYSPAPKAAGAHPTMELIQFPDVPGCPSAILNLEIVMRA